MQHHLEPGLLAPTSGMFDGEPNGVELALDDGTYDLFVTMDLDNDGTLTAPEPWILAEVTVAGDTTVAYTDVDLVATVSQQARIKYQGTTVPVAAGMTVYWQLQGSNEMPGYRLTTMQDPGYLAVDAAAFVVDGLSTSAVTPGTPLVAGVYDATIIVDMDADGLLETGDYLLHVNDVNVDGSMINFFTQLDAAVPLP